jgi:hypothetical protein
MNIDLSTPALLFSATSLILLAYTNRFLTIAQIVRGLKQSYHDNKTKSILLELKNLNLRLSLIRWMQLFGVLSLFLSVFAMLFLFFNLRNIGVIMFAISLLCLLVSLGTSFWEITISINALRLHLSDLNELMDANEEKELTEIRNVC